MVQRASVLCTSVKICVFLISEDLRETRYTQVEFFNAQLGYRALFLLLRLLLIDVILNIVAICTNLLFQNKSINGGMLAAMVKKAILLAQG
ncbi:MAG: hypothetical protein EOP49_21830 [Sphingobacteriales bacterium]|nr:MAG: hypothetical protein EOP49_21830 [Sphingobacteriales bacterium]